MDRDELTELRKSLEIDAASGLELFNKALGALELLDYFLSQLEDENDANGNDLDPDSTASSNGESSAGSVPVVGRETDTSADRIADSDPS